MPTVNDILKAHRQKTEESIEKGRYSSSRALCMYWKKLLSHRSDGFVKELTGQEQGQIRQFFERVGRESADKVMHWAVLNWNEFVRECIDKYGLTTGPADPIVGWLLKYHDVAVNAFTKKDLQSIAKPEPAAAVTAPIKKAPTPTKDIVSTDKVKEALEKLKKSHTG